MNPVEEVLGRFGSWCVEVPLARAPVVASQLAGGTGHRVFRLLGQDVRGERRDFVLREPVISPTPGAFETEMRLHRLAAQAGLAPAVIFADDDSRVSVLAFVESTDTDVTSRQLGQLLQEIHALDAPAEKLDLTAVLQHYRYLARSKQVPDKQILSADEQGFAAAVDILDAGPQVLCHNDLGRDNVIAGKRGLLAIDWEYGARNNPYFDVAAATAGWPMLDAEAVLASAVGGTADHHQWQAARAVYAAVSWNWHHARGIPVPTGLDLVQIRDDLVTLA